MTDAVLLAEIRTGSLAAELGPLANARQDADLAAALNLARDGAEFLVTIKVDRRRILKLLADRDLVLALSLAADDPEHPARSAAWHTRWVLQHQDFPEIDLADAASEAKISVLVSAGVLTLDDVNALLALGARQGSRMEVLDGPGAAVTTEQVSRALNEEAANA